MIKLVAEVNNRQMLLIGLSRENTLRLHADMPLVIDLQAIAQAASGRPVQDLVIFAGESEDALMKQLADHFPQWRDQIESHRQGPHVRG